MATKQEKEQLMQTLKFTPRTYKIELTGYGGEVAIGTVDRKVYDYFQENDIDFEQWADEWDNEAGVPDELMPFEPGSWFDCDNVCHETGVEMSDSCWVTVYDEKGQEVWQHTLDIGQLEEFGISTSLWEEVDPYEQPNGTVIVFGQSTEKGLFFGGEIHLTEPFDPKLLSFTHGNYDGWTLNQSVSYAGEDIDSNDYDTTGKGIYHSMYVVEKE